MDILVSLSVWFLICYLGGRIAERKGWRSSTGFGLGVLFGPFGLLVCALLPKTEAKREQLEHDKPAEPEP